jgi:hypothetical protein
VTSCPWIIPLAYLVCSVRGTKHQENLDEDGPANPNTDDNAARIPLLHGLDVDQEDSSVEPLTRRYFNLAGRITCTRWPNNRFQSDSPTGTILARGSDYNAFPIYETLNRAAAEAWSLERSQSYAYLHHTYVIFAALHVQYHGL